MLHRLHTRLRTLRLGLMLALALTGCRTEAPQPPAPGTFGWKPVRSQALGVSLRVPDVFEVAEEGNTLAFRYNGTPARLILATPAEASKRGLWADGEPREALRVDGREGRRHIYNHSDGPFYSHTVAYVFAHRGRELGLEFRTDADVLDPVQAEMLASLTFDQ